MENFNLFCHREWWLRLKMWWFTDQICRDSKRFSKSSYMLEFPHPRNDRCHSNIEKSRLTFNQFSELR
jgi:hypothetical protein